MMEINRLAAGLQGSGRVDGSGKCDGSGKAGRAARAEDAGNDSLSSLGVDLIASGPRDPARAARVESIRAAIASGTYAPDPVLVARKILGAE